MGYFLTIHDPEHRDRDILDALLFHAGAKSIEYRDDKILCYFSENKIAPERSIEQFLADLNINILDSQEVPEQNWVQRCEETWQSISEGIIQISPVLEHIESKNPQKTKTQHQIRIIPGSGFGTGHHTSTRFALSLLQEPTLTANPPSRFLDYGTGSGILAIAANTLYGSTGLAFDNDPLAIENARENLLQNNIQQEIQLENSTLQDIDGSYDLIFANIYAEVLIDSEPAIRERLKDGGLTILSGIVAEQRNSVLYTYKNWELCSERTDGQWYACLLKSL